MPYTDHLKDEVVDDAGCSVVEVLRSTHGFFGHDHDYRLILFLIQPVYLQNRLVA